uniref:Ulp1 protease family, C-terminal catalytic domain-containing protein n=1 Tax=Tanacetum cinerariifolium TaxID=118510 RepID=A0A6L2MPB8_TANCI|nr:hypothetical protein [Tanacetum cinerariifolium]
MATQGTSTFVDVGSSNESTIVEVIETTRNKDIWQHYDLCKMSDGSKKGRCKHCDAQERIQHTLNLEGDCLEIEQQLQKVELEAGYPINIVDEEIVLEQQAMSGSAVKGISRVSPMKSKVNDKSDSPRRSCCEGKDSCCKGKGGYCEGKADWCYNKVSKGKDDVVKAPVVADEVTVVADKALVVKATVTDKAPVVKATVADNVVADKEPVKEKSAGNVGKATVKDKVKVSVLKDSLAPVKDNVKAPIKDNVEVSVLKGNLLVDVVPDDMVLNKAMGKASIKDKFKAPVKDNVKVSVKDNVKAPVKDKPKQKVIPTVQELSEIHFESPMIHIESHEIQSDSFESHEIQCKSQDNVKAPVKEKHKQKVIPTVQESSELSNLRSSNQKVKPEVKSKVAVCVLRSKETRVRRKRSLSKEDDRKRKLKENIKRLISKLENKVKKQESDEESVPKKGKKKLTRKVKKEESDKESVPKKELKQIRVNDIASKLVVAQEIDVLFKVNFLTLFSNTMGKCAGLKGQICLDVVRRLREDSVISDIDWCGYIYDYVSDSKLPKGTNHYLGPLTFLILLYLDSTKFDRFPVVRTRPIIRKWSSYLMNKRHDLELKDHVLGVLDLHGEWTEFEVQNGEGFIGSLKTFEKKVYDDFGNDSGPTEKESVDPTEHGTVFEGNLAEECEIMSTSENYTQWLERNADLVGETFDSITDEYLYGDLFGDNSVTMEVMNQGLLTPKIMLSSVSNVSPSPEERIVKPSCYMLSPYMSKKT